MMETKTEMLRVRCTAEFKAAIDNASANLQLPLSELIRKAVDSYIAQRARSAAGAFTSRALLFFCRTRGMTFDEAMPLVERVTPGDDLLAMEALSNSELVTDKAFGWTMDVRLGKQTVGT